MSQQVERIRQLLASGQASEAEKLATSALEQTTPSTQLHGLYAQCLLKLNRQDEAIAYLQKQLGAGKQGSAQLAADLAGLYLQTQQFNQAATYFNRALAHAPKSDQLWHLLGIAQYQSGDKTQAYASFAKAEQYDAFRPLLEKAQDAIKNNDADTCRTAVNDILGKFPCHPQASFLLASMLLQSGQLERAAEQVNQALRYSPYHQNLWNMLAQIQVQLCDFEAALYSGQRLVELDPKSHKHRLMLADIQHNAGQMTVAIESYHKAGELGAEQALCKVHIAHIRQSLGDHQQAIDLYRDCLLSPDHVGSALWGLQTISRYSPTQQEIELMEQTQLNPELSIEQACQASFSLARLQEKNGNVKAAFYQYNNANTLKSGLRYVPDKAAQKFASIKQTFTHQCLAKQTKASFPEHSATPVFIVGLPRTGSTLTEHILASHSQVEATMELKALPAIARRAYLQSCRKPGNQRGDISCLSDAELNQLGQAYLKLTQIYREGRPYFIDKLPPNFQHLGLIKKILPQAIIIETRRQPMAWGMAVFRQYFAQGHDYSYDFAHIAHAYQNYLGLMRHWHRCLGNWVFTLEYEKLVTDTEAQVNTLLQHCGLAFEPACLSSHQHRRYVRTASSDQVRQPIYQSAIDSWKKYEVYLAPLKSALANYQVDI